MVGKMYTEQFEDFNIVYAAYMDIILSEAFLFACALKLTIWVHVESIDNSFHPTARKCRVVT